MAAFSARNRIRTVNSARKLAAGRRLVLRPASMERPQGGKSRSYGNGPAKLAHWQMQCRNGDKIMAARIRHIALSVKDIDATADFYEKAFGLKRSPKSEGPTAYRVYMSDGEINLALLQYKSE